MMAPTPALHLYRYGEPSRIVNSSPNSSPSRISSNGAPGLPVKSHTVSLAELHVRTHLSDSESSSSSASPIAARVARTFELPPLRRLIMLTAALWLAVGWLVLVGKKKLAHMSGVEGIAAVLYWQVQIITTVGYGDMCPDSDDTRLFVAVYVVVGNVVAGVGVMDYLTSVLAQGAEETKKDLLSKSLAESMGEGSRSPKRALAEAKSMGKHSALMKALLAFLTMISLGTVFFSFVDYCVCEDFDTCDVVLPFGETQSCLDLGGTRRTVLQAFYMSCITLTTVGYGDVVPGNWLGRLFASVWMVAGVASMAQFLGQLARAVNSNSVKRTVSHGMSEETFRMIDADNSGSLTKYEYVVYMLLNFDMVDASDVQELLEVFDDMDSNQNGLLEYVEVAVHQHHHHQ